MKITLEGVKFRRTDEGQVIYAYSGKVMPDLCNGQAYDVIIKPRAKDEEAS